MSVLDALKRKPLELSYTLYGRPMTTKNARALGAGKSFINAKARRRLDELRVQLRQQHLGKPRGERFDMTITIYYSDLRSWLDSDNAASFVGDLIKGIVVPDDKPACLRDWTCKPRLSRNKEDKIEIRLVEVL